MSEENNKSKVLLGVPFPQSDIYVKVIKVSEEEYVWSKLAEEEQERCTKRELEAVLDWMSIEMKVKNPIPLSKPMYKAKDETLKEGVYIGGMYYAPGDDLA